MWRFLVVLLVCCRVGFASSPVRIYNDTQVTTNGNWGLMNTSEQYATYSSRGSPVINWSLSPGQESWYYDNYGSGYGAMAWLGNDWNFGWEGANWGQTILVSELGVVSPPTNNYCYACVSGINEDTFLTVRATAIEYSSGFSPRYYGPWLLRPRQPISLCVTNTDMARCPFSLTLSIDRPGFDTPTNITANSTSTNMTAPPNGSGGGGGSGGEDFLTNSPPIAGGTNAIQRQDLNTVAGGVSYGLGVLDGQLTDIKEELQSFHRDNTNQLSNLTNGQAVGNANLIGMSNLLSRGVAALEALTNSPGVGTNGYLVEDYQTNADAAWSLGESLGSVSNFNAAITAGESVASGVGVLGEGVGASTGMSFMFCGVLIDLDPEARFPGMLALIKKAWTFILVTLFCLSVGRLFVQVAGYLMGLNSGGVPDMEVGGEVSVAGFGISLSGNMLGWIMAGLGAFAIIGVGVLAFNWIWSGIMSSVGLLPSAAENWTMGGNSIALYLLNASFPLSLFCSLLSLRIALQFTAAKFMAICFAAARLIMAR